MAKIYLSNYELKEAIDKFMGYFPHISAGVETIPTEEALGRVTSEVVFAKISSPHYNASAMDGIAVKSEMTHKASEKWPVYLKENVDFIPLDTGDPIPKEFDAVIMIEDIVKTDENTVRIINSASSWQNIRAIGEDIVESQLILPSGHKIRPVDIGSLLAGGVNEVKVQRKPIVGIIPTGTELVEPGVELKTGDIIDFNSRVFSADVLTWNGIPKRYPIVIDDFDKIKAAVSKAIEECDIVLINAGSSAGREDFTSSVIEELGELIIHGVAIKPGKPVMLGKINNKPIIGIPGYPVSAYFIMEHIAKKIIMKAGGLQVKKDVKVQAKLLRRVMSSLKYLEFVRVRLGYVDGQIVATPLERGAGATMSLVKADGILEIEQNLEGIDAGEEVTVTLNTDENDIKNTLVTIGSHDVILDVISDLMNRESEGSKLSTAHVGSLGGITALKNHETHMAPVHLLDEDTGVYNVSWIKKYLKDEPMALIKCVKRIQGLMVPHGNPKNIQGFKDLDRVSFVNRQRGSGTRVLLDYYLSKNNIDIETIKGYDREETTHLAVASAVASGDADCGLGVLSAAKSMGLDFIELCSEDYDMAIPQRYLEMENVKLFIDIIKSDRFKEILDTLGGYSTEESGKIVRID
ncbi:MAG: molybdopterin biosynthesis protein [Clostridiaceae bacterium]